MLRTRLLPWLALVGVAVPPVAAGASTLRFNTTAAGNVTATGNTLGLAKELNANGPGTRDSIGTFITLDPTSIDNHPVNLANPWGVNTTEDWTENGAEAVLVLPKDAEVLYAELVWGGSTYYGPTEDVTAFLDDAVTLGFGVDATDVSPDPETGLVIDEPGNGFLAHYYMRTADVTAFVAEHGAGTYDVSGVPGTQDTSINSLNAAGWTLVVAYRDSAQQIRNLTVFVGGSFVDENATEDYEFEGFCTPPMGPFTGGAVVSAIEGDANLVGDQLVIGPNAAGPFVNLSGPNNPQNNFFASQINGADGLLDSSGSFGNANHDAILGINASGGRQGWDITHVGLSSDDGQLDNGQTAAVLRTQTTGDSYVPTTVAFAIGVNAPDFSGKGTGASIDPGSLAIDDDATVTVTMNNVGLVDAENIAFTMPLPNGLSLDAFTIDGNAGDIDGNAVAAADLTTGVAIGTVGPGEVRQIVVSLSASGEPDDPDAGWTLAPGWTYDYVSCVGEPPLEEPYNAPWLELEFEPAAATTGGADESGGTTAADSSGGADSDSNSASASEGDASASASATDSADDSGGISDSDSAGVGDGSDNGCGCTTRRGPAPASLLLVGAGVLVVGRRRRRAR
ncbi:MAG: hypothetical protein IPH07_04915 [Deltaproteobacteria bacterium]|nr:hypothetical protein [Deltaproteobacteria bacterium]MBP7290670.1 hypothetical protein [Nannocystaceae bacterium]